MSAERAGAKAIAVLGALVALSLAVAWPHRWTNDDAYITFRYAENLAGGHGFVWNTVDPEPVEGTTSLGWTLLNAAAIRAGFDPVAFSHAMGLAASAAGLVLVWLAGRRGFGWSPAFALLPVAVLALQRQWIVWSVAGMETRAASVAALAATLLFARAAGGGPARAALAGVAFFLATLLRPEAPLLHLAAGAGLVFAAPRREVLRDVVVSGGVHAVLLGALTAWRLATFGRPLPNTFYVKVGGIQLDDGLWYVLQFVWRNHGWLWLPLIAAGFVLARRGGGGVPRLAWAFAAQGLAWTVWVALVGGGAWEFRFFDPLLAGIALLSAAGVGRLASSVRARARLVTAAAAGVLVVTQAVTLVTPWPESLWPIVSYRHLDREVRGLLAEGRILARYLSPSDRICIGWAGALPYVTRAWHLDPWGLNDRRIAERPFDPEAVIYHQRHATWDDVVERDVMFCDIFNEFLYETPASPVEVIDRYDRALMPWARLGIAVFCLELPRERRYWIFASPRPIDEVRRWAESRGMRLMYVVPLPFDPGEEK